MVSKKSSETRKVLLPNSRLWKMLHVSAPCNRWISLNQGQGPDGIEFSEDHLLKEGEKCVSDSLEKGCI